MHDANCDLRRIASDFLTLVNRVGEANRKPSVVTSSLQILRRKDRIVHLEKVRRLHEKYLAFGFGSVYLP